MCGGRGPDRASLRPEHQKGGCLMEGQRVGTSIVIGYMYCMHPTAVALCPVHVACSRSRPTQHSPTHSSWNTHCSRWGCRGCRSTSAGSCRCGRRCRRGCTGCWGRRGSPGTGPWELRTRAGGGGLSAHGPETGKWVSAAAYSAGRTYAPSLQTGATLLCGTMQTRSSEPWTVEWVHSGIKPLTAAGVGVPAKARLACAGAAATAVGRAHGVGSARRRDAWVLWSVCSGRKME